MDSYANLVQFMITDSGYALTSWISLSSFDVLTAAYGYTFN